jgi:hypothetical protein
MREARDHRPGRSIGDEVIDEVARVLMDHQPAAGFGRRIAARLDDVPATSRQRPGVLVSAARVVVAGVLLALVASLWQANRPWQVPGPSQPRVATRAPADAVTTPASETALAPTQATTRVVKPARLTRGVSRADRLWASRAAPEVERIVVTPVPDPDPVTVQPLEVPGMALDDLAIEPLAVDSLSPDHRMLPQ